MGGLRVAIVGAGIGGAATAAALHQRGVAVEVYEQAPELHEIGAAIGLHPNGVRMLDRLGLRRPLEALGARWTDVHLKEPDGTLIAPWWPEDWQDRIEIFGVHRADLLSMLLSRVPDGAIHLGSRCVGVAQGHDTARLTFADGGSVEADVVIGADGVHSRLLRHVTDEPSYRPVSLLSYRGVVDAAAVGEPMPGMRVWFTAGQRMMIVPIRGGRQLCFAAFLPARVPMTGPGPTRVVDGRQMRAAFAEWDEPVRRLVAAVETCVMTQLVDREPLPRWVEGRVALMGDAAHPMLPFVGQGATQSLEDALTLGSLLARADAASAPEWLSAYQSLRRERTAQVQNGARSTGGHYNAARQERDRGLGNQARDRAWIWDHDAWAAAEALADSVVMA